MEKMSWLKLFWPTTILSVLLFSMGLVPVYSQQIQLPYEEEPSIVVDGIVSVGEYPVKFTDQSTGIDVNWVHNGSLLFIALSGDSMGWLSIGLGSTNAKMDGSNIVIGSVIENVVHVVDEVGVGHNHYPDTSKGGESNIIKSGGKISDMTSIEFIIPLNSGDQMDYTLNPGETYGLFLALNEDDADFSKIHSIYSKTYIFNIEAPPNEISSKRTGFNYLLLTLLIPIMVYLYWRKTRPPVYRFSEMHN